MIQRYSLPAYKKGYQSQRSDLSPCELIQKQQRSSRAQQLKQNKHMQRLNQYEAQVRKKLSIKHSNSLSKLFHKKNHSQNAINKSLGHAKNNKNNIPSKNKNAKKNVIAWKQNRQALGDVNNRVQKSSSFDYETIIRQYQQTLEAKVRGNSVKIDKKKRQQKRQASKTDRTTKSILVCESKIEKKGQNIKQKVKQQINLIQKSKKQKFKSSKFNTINLSGAQKQQNLNETAYFTINNHQSHRPSNSLQTSLPSNYNTIKVQSKNKNFQTKSLTSRKTTKKNSLQKDLSSLSPRSKALIKIHNRLRVAVLDKSQGIRKSKSGQQATLEVELRMRKQIKDKINIHPIIFRKHGFVVA